MPIRLETDGAGRRVLLTVTDDRRSAAALADLLAALRWTKVDEVPFDFERRRLSVVVERAGTCTIITKGAPESVFAVCTTYEREGAMWPLDADARARCDQTFRDLSRRGFRVPWDGRRSGGR